jgi:hypothetical protein
VNHTRRRTDDEMLAVDVPGHIRAGLREPSVAGGHTIDGDAAVAAAVAADRLGVFPRSLTFLAEVARRGGREYAAGLADPLPTAEQAALARPWLDAAAEAAPSGVLDEVFARWLEAVATVVHARRQARGLPG